MDSKVIFDVLQNIRFNVLGKVGLVTPIEFSNWEHEQKDELYRRLFDAVFDSCESLSALMTINSNYMQLNSANNID
jgi:hypothetical protein